MFWREWERMAAHNKLAAKLWIAAMAVAIVAAWFFPEV